MKPAFGTVLLAQEAQGAKPPGETCFLNLQSMHTLPAWVDACALLGYVVNSMPTAPRAPRHAVGARPAGPAANVQLPLLNAPAAAGALRLLAPCNLKNQRKHASDKVGGSARAVPPKSRADILKSARRIVTFAAL